MWTIGTNALRINLKALAPRRKVEKTDYVARLEAEMKELAEQGERAIEQMERLNEELKRIAP